jgi:Transposase DNA-binding/Transposase Tn5 dimerisation domain
MHTHTLWAARVAAGTVLPDKRLQTRLACILEAFAERPSDAIPQAAGSWGQAKGIYRFLANQRVRPDALHQGLTSDTARQCVEQPTVLVVQDTTSLNLTGCHVLPELGPIGSGNLAQGVLLHSTLALTEQGAVLGVLGLQTWVRPAGDAPGPEAKESGKWLHGIDQARQVVWETVWAAAAAAPPHLIHLMDREGDVYEVLQWVEEVGDSAIIRCVQNRRVEDPLRLAHAAVRAQPVLGRVTLTVPRSHGKPARTATVEMRALTTTLRPDRAKYPHAWPLTWTLVEVWEPNPAPADEALHWLLWTREPAATLPEVREVVRKYTCRWPIEEYHLTLKSGCRIEALRLESWDSLAKAVVMYTSVAARIVALRDRAQQEPDALATVLLSEDECAVLVAKFGTGRAVLPLTLGQAVLWIGRLGGHLNRTRDGMPGVRTLWRGLRDLTLLVEGGRVARRLENRCG